MTDAHKKAMATAALAAGILLLAGCTSGKPDGANATSAEATATPAGEQLVASGEVTGGTTTVVDPATASFVTEGKEVSSRELGSFTFEESTEYVYGFYSHDTFLEVSFAAGNLTDDGYLSPDTLGWSDGTFHSLGDTSQAVPGDAPRGVQRTTVEGDTVAWVESPSSGEFVDPWRIFAVSSGASPVLVAMSEQLEAGEPEPYAMPSPVISGDRVYWSLSATEGPGQPVATWSAPLAGGEAPRVESVGYQYPAATSAGVLVLASAPDAADTTEWGETERRIVKLGGPTAEPVLTFDTWRSGGEPRVFGAGDWVGVLYEAPGSASEVLVGNVVTGEGFAVPLGKDVEYPAAILCESAVVWTSHDTDFTTSFGIHRLDLETGELTWFEAPGLWSLVDCDGDAVLWSSGDYSAWTTWVTTWS